MKYQAVILNFDRQTVQYVAPKDMPKPMKKSVGVRGVSPPPSPKRGR
jgi:hypothetical protein